MYMAGGGGGHIPLKRDQDVRFPEAGVTEGCRQTEPDAGIQTLVSTRAASAFSH